MSLSKEEMMEFYRFNIIDTINRCKKEQDLSFVFHVLNRIKPEVIPMTQEERQARADFYGIDIEDVALR